MGKALRLLLALGVVVGMVTACRTTPVLPEAERPSAYDAAPWRRVLAGGVRDGLVDYRAVRDHHQDDLNAYLAAVAHFGPTTTPEQFPTRADELAYYLNAYNALVIRRWLDAGAGLDQPRLEDVNVIWFFADHWRIDGRWMSLNTLEQQHIRRGYGDPRMHFALVCGAISCPPLLEEPFDGARLDAQLDGLGRRWLREGDDGLVIGEDGSVELSLIFMWYFDDYREWGGMPGLLERYLDPADPRLETALRAIDAGEARWLPYFWRINDVQTRAGTTAPAVATGPTE